MSAINPIIDSPLRISEELLQVPQYVKDARKEEEKELTIQIRIKLAIYKGPKTKISKQKTLTHKKISSKQFNSFIDRNYRNSDCVQKGAIKRQNWANIRSVAEGSMRELKEMLKGAGKKEQKVLKELIELKKLELGLIYNY